MSCDESRDFWVRWSFNSIRVGRGFIPGLFTLAELKETDYFTIKGVAIANSGVPPAEWKFDKDIGKW